MAIDTARHAIEGPGSVALLALASDKPQAVATGRG